MSQSDQIIQHRFDATIRETHPIDQRAVFGKAKYPWFRIAGLGNGRDRPCFDGSESEREQGGKGDGILVESCCDA